jgi:hypothetical protein
MDIHDLIQLCGAIALICTAWKGREICVRLTVVQDQLDANTLLTSSAKTNAEAAAANAAAAVEIAVASAIDIKAAVVKCTEVHEGLAEDIATVLKKANGH